MTFDVYNERKFIIATILDIPNIEYSRNKTFLFINIRPSAKGTGTAYPDWWSTLVWCDEGILGIASK